MRRCLPLFVVIMVIMGYVACEGASPATLYNDNTTGTGLPFETSIVYSNWSCDVLVSDNTTTAVVVVLEGNQCTQASCSAAQLNKYSPVGMTGATGFSLSAAELGAGIGAFSVVGLPVQRIRVKLITLTGGTNPVVTVRCSGAQ